MKRTNRDSRFELLRILAMVSIVMGHLIGQNDFTTSNKLSQFILGLMGGNARIACNLFLMIGAWFLVEKQFKFERILKLWLKVFLFTVPVTLAIYILNGCTLLDLIDSLFPLLRRRIWFVAAYIVMIAFSPILNLVLEIKKRYIEYILVLGIGFICVVCSFARLMDTFICSFTWFLYVYIFIGYLKKYRGEILFSDKRRKLRRILFVISVCLYFLLVTISWYSIGTENKIIDIAGKTARQYLGDYKCLVNFIISFGVFILFAGCKSFSNKLINYISSHTLMVYIFHQTPAFIPILWKKIFFVDEWKYSELSPIYICACTIMIFVSSILVDFVIDHIIICVCKTKLYLSFSNKIDKILMPLQEISSSE